MSGRFCYVLALCFLAGAAWLSYSAEFDPDDGARRAEEIRQTINSLQRDNAQTTLEIDEMRALVDAIKTDPARMEELARRRLQMIKPGEIFVIPAEE